SGRVIVAIPSRGCRVHTRYAYCVSMRRRRRANGYLVSLGASLIALSLVGLVAIGARPGLLERLSRGDQVADGADGDRVGGGCCGEESGPEMVPPPPTDRGPAETGEFGWTVATGGTGQVGSGPLYRYRVEVETVTGIDANEVARVVDGVLAHP